MRLMLQAQHAQPARQPDRPRRRLSQRLPAQERHRQRPVKQRKVLLLQSHQKARQLPVPVRRKRQKRMRQRHKNRQPLLHPPRPRKRQKLPPQPGMRRLQKWRQNHQKRALPRAPAVQLPRQRQQEIPRRPQKRLRRMRITAQERHRQRPVKQRKCCCCRVIKKRGSYQCRCGENVRNECGSVTKIGSHFCIHRDHESVRSCHLSPGCVGFKSGGKIIRNERCLERRQCSFLGNGSRKFREGRKNV